MGEVVRTSLHVILMLMGSFCTCFGCNGESEEAMFCQDNWGSRWCPSISELAGCMHACSNAGFLKIFY